MKEKIRKFLGWKTTQEIDRENYIDGYDWAAGALLRGETTPAWIEAHSFLILIITNLIEDQ